MATDPALAARPGPNCSRTVTSVNPISALTWAYWLIPRLAISKLMRCTSR